MVAVLKSDCPELRAMRPEDVDAVSAIELRAYDFPWTIGIFRDCIKAGY